MDFSPLHRSYKTQSNPTQQWVYPSIDGGSSGSTDPSHATTQEKSAFQKTEFVLQKHASKQKKRHKLSLRGFQAQQQLQMATTGRGRN